MTEQTDTGEAPEELPVSDELYCMRQLAHALVQYTNSGGVHPLLEKTHGAHLYAEHVGHEGYANLSDTTPEYMAAKWAALRAEWVVAPIFTMDGVVSIPSPTQTEGE